MVANVNLVGSGETLDESLNTIISEFKLLSQETPVVKPTATKYRLMPGKGSSYNVNNYERVVAYDLSFGVDMAQAQELADDRSSYTPGEVGVQVILSGQALRQSADRSLESNTAKMLNNAWQLKEDSDGCAQFASFTGTLGSAGTVISPGHAEAAASRLRIGNNRANPEPAPKPWHAVIHPLSVSVLRGRIIPYGSTPGGAAAYGANTGANAGVTTGPSAAASDFTIRMMKEGPGSLGQYAGLMVREDANISVDASDDAVNGFYSTEQLVYVEEVAPRLDPDMSDKSMRGAVEMNLWGSYAWGTYRPQLAVAGTFDASLPTS